MKLGILVNIMSRIDIEGIFVDNISRIGIELLNSKVCTQIPS
jgi:hypothetical protein